PKDFSAPKDSSANGDEESRLSGLPIPEDRALRRAVHRVLPPRSHGVEAEGRVPQATRAARRSPQDQLARRLREVRGAREEALVLATADGERVLTQARLDVAARRPVRRLRTAHRTATRHPVAVRAREQARLRPSGYD